MARVKNNMIMQGISGQINKQIVYKVYGDKTILTHFPNMSNVKFNEKQKAEQSLFAEAVYFAKSIINDPEKKEAFKATIEPGRNVFNAAISAFLKEHKK
jgi:hypothetical protein